MKLEVSSDYPFLLCSVRFEFHEFSKEQLYHDYLIYTNNPTPFSTRDFVIINKSPVLVFIDYQTLNRLKEIPKTRVEEKPSSPLLVLETPPFITALIQTNQVQAFLFTNPKSQPPPPPKNLHPQNKQKRKNTPHAPDEATNQPQKPNIMRIGKTCTHQQEPGY